MHIKCILMIYFGIHFRNHTLTLVIMQKWCELKFDKKQTYDTLEIIQTSSGLIMLQVHEL